MNASMEQNRPFFITFYPGTALFLTLFFLISALPTRSYSRDKSISTYTKTVYGKKKKIINVTTVPIEENAYAIRNVPGRKSPIPDSIVITVIEEGSRVIVKKASHDMKWYKVIYNRKYLWVPSTTIHFIGDSPDYDSIQAPTVTPGMEKTERISRKKVKPNPWSLDTHYDGAGLFLAPGYRVMGPKGLLAGIGGEANIWHLHTEISVNIISPITVEMCLGGRYDIALNSQNTFQLTFTANTHGAFIFQSKSGGRFTELSLGVNASARIQYNLRGEYYFFVAPIYVDADFFQFLWKSEMYDYTYDVYVQPKLIIGAGFLY